MKESSTTALRASIGSKQIIYGFNQLKRPRQAISFMGPPGLSDRRCRKSLHLAGTYSVPDTDPGK